MKKLILTCLVLLALSASASAAEKESVYDRVMRTGTIRCGYAIWTPVLFKDMNTGKLQGLTYDLMEQIGKRLNLKIEWAEETGWGTIVEGLHTGRYDMICTGIANSSARIKFIDFSAPAFFLPAYLVARKNDGIFDKNHDLLNNGKYKIAVLDGEISSIMAVQLYPKAALDSMPQTSDYSLLLKEVETKKADVTIIEPETFYQYEQHNPGILKIVDKSHPLNVLPASFGVPINDLAFKRMIDVTLSELIYDGTVAKLVKKYEKVPGSMLLPTRPYEVLK
ncbi:MAG: amino acid ABC transporter substrate-binding protein [Proteobacteria bacterium]|nr:amino acid ABC transporter substrate-binding protein [Pseudomonadota bacterium]